MPRLSYKSQHRYIEANDEGGAFHLGAGPIPVFALVRVDYDQAIALRAMLNSYIREERHRRSPKCPVIFHDEGCDCGGMAGDR